jgi:hypothetical protein
MSDEHPLWCAGVEGCEVVSRRSHNLRMLVEHPLSLHHLCCVGIEAQLRTDGHRAGG